MNDDLKPQVATSITGYPLTQLSFVKGLEIAELIALRTRNYPLAEQIAEVRKAWEEVRL